MVEYGPVKVIGVLNFQEGEEFDFKKQAEDRSKLLQQSMLDYFTGGEKKLTEEESIRTNLKYAVIYEGDIRRIVYVDQKTMKAYRMINNDYYMGGLEKPLNEITSFTFERWCSGMDI